MDSKGQLGVFCICIAVGFVGGMLYEVVVLLRALFRCGKGKNKILGIILDTTFFIGLALLFTYAAYRFRFPALRVYMWIGYAVGGIIYLKTLRRILAFLQKVCYNRIAKMAEKYKTKKKLSKMGDTV
ncbi:MAG: hypothetical protein E7352_02560 [Clostridiales bacterium]|nr:hypothetical protein [Clostridiales bacterium]